MMKLRSLFVIAPFSMLCMALPAQPETEKAEARTLKIIPVSDMLMSIPAVRSPRLGVLTSKWPEDETIELASQDPFSLVSSDQLAELVRNGLGDEGAETTVVLKNRTLIVTGNTDNVSKAEKIVEALRRTITQRIVVQARLYRIKPTDEYPAVADAARLATLCKNLPLIWSGHSTAMSGQQVALSQERFTSYIADVDIEVAEEAKVGRPKTTTMFEGIRLVVEPHALIGTTDRVLKCQFAIGEKDKDIEDVSTGVENLPQIGIPHLRANSGVFSGRVNHDGALLLSLQSRADAGSNLLLVVQAAKNGLPAGKQTPAGGTLLLPVSAIASQFLRYPRTVYESEGTRGAYPTTAASDDDEVEDDLGELLVNLLNENLGAILDSDDVSLDLTQNGHGSGYILLHAPEHVQVQITRLLMTMQDFWLGTTEVKLRTVLRPTAATATTFSEITPSTNQPTPTYHAVTFPSLHDHAAIVMKGIESRLIRDFEVEIAKKSTIANPMMQTTFNGLAVGFRGAQQGQNSTGQLSVDLQYLPEPRHQPTAQSGGGNLYHARVRRAHFQHHGRIALDQDLPLGFGPRLQNDQEGARMHQSMRFRRL
ncbi:MAG: hypothetical protein VX951_11190 [Planctomycetota bacterium]|nr:hypothetical protein [Planctomycetota bacterium]